MENLLASAYFLDPGCQETSEKVFYIDSVPEPISFITLELARVDGFERATRWAFSQ